MKPFYVTSQKLEEELLQRNRAKELELAVSDLRVQQGVLRRDAAQQLQELTKARLAIRCMHHTSSLKLNSKL